MIIYSFLLFFCSSDCPYMFTPSAEILAREIFWAHAVYTVHNMLSLSVLSDSIFKYSVLSAFIKTALI